MTEKRHERKQKRDRIIIWFGLTISILFGLTVANSPLPKPEYVPTSINGLVTSMSILMAFAFFSITQFHTNIQDKYAKMKFHLLAMKYLASLFVI